MIAGLCCSTSVLVACVTPESLRVRQVPLTDKLECAVGDLVLMTIERDGIHIFSLFHCSDFLISVSVISPPHSKSYYSSLKVGGTQMENI